MPHAYIALLGFCLLQFLLLFGMLFIRLRALKNGATPQDITPDNCNISHFAYRLSRAHANCYENIGLLAAIIIVAAFTESLEIMNVTALIFLAARYVQAGTHLYSGNGFWLPVRGVLFGVQVVIQLYWVIILLAEAL